MAAEPMEFDPAELERFLARTRRKLSACRAGPGVVGGAPAAEVAIADLGPGFLTWKVIDDGAATPTASSDRVFWIAPGRAITGQDVRDAIAHYRALGRRRAFFVISPSACTDALMLDMTREGLKPWPQVRYPVLARPTADLDGEVWRESALHVRILRTSPDGRGIDELDGVLASIGPWYGTEWLPLVRRVVVEVGAELHVAFDGDPDATPAARPVSIGGLVVDGNWSYVCFGATEESSRGRGGQTSLFRSRLASAARLGATWCAGETNTMAAQSLKNFLRCGFTEAFQMQVWGWEEAGA